MGDCRQAAEITTAKLAAALALFHKKCQPAAKATNSRSVRELVAADLAWRDASPQQHIITQADENYPPLLRQVKGAPKVLFVRGAADLLCFPLFGIVGPRQATREGLKNAREFSSYIARSGMCVVSGLAHGVDRCAHEHSLAEPGKTIAIMGTGIELIYPRQHQKLSEEILAAGGALVSMFPRGTPPRPHNFPARNRVISGVSLGVLVVEAGLRSGAMITARLAAEQGREVFAIPGSIHNPVAKGTNALIKQGANLVESYQDIINHLAPVYASYGLEIAKPQQAAALEEKAGTARVTSGAVTAKAAKTTEPDLLAVTALAPADAGTQQVRTHETQLATAGSQAAAPRQATKTAPQPARHTAQSPAPPDLAEALPRRILKELAAGALSAEQLVELTATSISSLNASLLDLELQGLIYQEKMLYYLVR